jgi:hypothetical protein
MEEQPTKTPQQQMREAVNAAGVAVVAAGFNAIDELADLAKTRIKRAILDALTSKPANRIRRPHK